MSCQRYPKLSDLHQSGDRWGFPFKITNHGASSIQLIHVDVKVGNLKQNSETSQVQFSLLGPGASASAEAWFDRKPTREELKFQVVSFGIH